MIGSSDVLVGELAGGSDGMAGRGLARSTRRKAVQGTVPLAIAMHFARNSPYRETILGALGSRGQRYFQ